MAIKLKTPKEINLIRESCVLSSEVLYRASELVKPGITTDEIDKFVYEFTIKNGAIPSPLNYKGFPKSVCTSVNNVVCHGIPGDYVLKDGDIVNIDVTSYLNGYHGDLSKTVLVGNVSEELRKLVEVTYKCLMVGIKEAYSGNYLNEIGNSIQGIADEYGYGVVREYCGHGIGRVFHEEPSIIHFRSPQKGIKIVEGMVFTIEPMINEGLPGVVLMPDKWTVVTKDGKCSAQFEHTLAMTENGPEILTKYL